MSAAPGAGVVHRVLLIRPWTDAHGGAGCCSGTPRDSVALDQHVCGPVEHDHATRVTAQAYRELRRELPEVDVQLVSAGNTAYLLPAALRAPGPDRWRGAWRRVREATRPGALVVDGRYVGDVVELGAAGVVRTVRSLLY